MLNYRTILCALDFEPGSRRALRCAADLAERSRAALHLLHVRDLLREPGAPPADPTASPASDARVRAFAGTMLGEAAYDARAPFVHEWPHGSPADGILQCADSIAADLIVVGTHGRHGLGHLLLGSVAADVLRRSAVPVLVVPESAERVAPGAEAPVLVGVDFSEHTGPALAAARGMAGAFGAAIEIVHVRDTPREALIDARARPPLHPPTGVATREEAHAALDTWLGTDAGQRHVVPGRPANELLRLAERERAGIVVVGTHGRRGWDRLRLGSVAEAVARQAPCPVLVVPRPATRSAAA